MVAVSSCYKDVLIAGDVGKNVRDGGYNVPMVLGRVKGFCIQNRYPLDPNRTKPARGIQTLDLKSNSLDLYHSSIQGAGAGAGRCR